MHLLPKFWSFLTAHASRKHFFDKKIFFLKIRHFLLSLVSFMGIHAELSILWLFKKSSYTNSPYETLKDMI